MIKGELEDDSHPLFIFQIPHNHITIVIMIFNCNCELIYIAPRNEKLIKCTQVPCNSKREDAGSYTDGDLPISDAIEVTKAYG